jgi:hypothetical protein
MDPLAACCAVMATFLLITAGIVTTLIVSARKDAARARALTARIRARTIPAPTLRSPIEEALLRNLRQYQSMGRTAPVRTGATFERFKRKPAQRREG